jgi:hypothetical protein
MNLSQTSIILCLYFPAYTWPIIYLGISINHGSSPGTAYAASIPTHNVRHCCIAGNVRERVAGCKRLVLYANIYLISHLLLLYIIYYPYNTL